MKQRLTQRLLPSASLLILLLLACSGFTCKHKALQTSTGVAASLSALQNGEIALYGQGRVTPDEHKLLQEGFKTLFQTDKSVRQCIYDSGAANCVDSAISAVNYFVNSNANGIKNPDSKAQITLLAEAVITSLNVLKGAL